MRQSRHQLFKSSIASEVMRSKFEDMAKKSKLSSSMASKRSRHLKNKENNNTIDYNIMHNADKINFVGNSSSHMYSQGVDKT